MRLILAIVGSMALGVPTYAQDAPGIAGSADEVLATDEAALLGRVIVASALCPDFALDKAADDLLDARASAGEDDFRDQVADAVESVFPLLVGIRASSPEEFSAYCQTVRDIANRLGLGG